MTSSGGGKGDEECCLPSWRELTTCDLHLNTALCQNNWKFTVKWLCRHVYRYVLKGVHIRMYVQRDTYVRMYVHTYVRTYCIYHTLIALFTSTHTYVCTYIHRYTHTVHTYVCTYICTCVCVTTRTDVACTVGLYTAMYCIHSQSSRHPQCPETCMILRIVLAHMSHS